MKKTDTTRGFTLLLAALVTSIVLSLGTAVFSLAQKELTLSSIGKSSQFAFYAADGAAECALYWDIRYSYFATTTPSVTLSCNGQTPPVSGRTTTYPQTITFQFEPNGYCVNVSVAKTAAGSVVHTVIHADGFSTDCASISTSARALQRSVELHY